MAATASVEEGKRPRGRPRKVGDAVRRRPKLTVRLRAEVRAEIEAAAATRGRSMSEEIEARVEESARQDGAFGGPEARQIVLMMAVAFCTAAQRRAGGNPRWVDDPGCYRAGMAAVLEALLLGLPDAESSAMALELEAIKGRLLTRLQERWSERPAQDRPAKRRPAA